MEGKYFFGDELRWNIGWENPNQAGAFLATAIPFVWALFEVWWRGEGKALRSGWTSLVAVWGLILCETGLWYLLCKTYSRGALLALVLAAFFHLVFQCWEPLGQKRKSMVAEFGLRAAIVVILLVTTGFIGRVNPGFVVEDASAGNRLSLWRGGLRMVAESPLHGWGKGQSGKQFMHWFQSLDADEMYAGMVNSYLHVSVERGLLPMVLSLTGILCFVLLGVMLRSVGGRRPVAKGNSREGGSLGGANLGDAKRSWTGALALAASSSLIAFLVANVFSTLWIFPKLWVIPAVAAILLFLLFVINGVGKSAVMLGRAALGGGRLAMGLAGGIFLLGKSLDEEVEVDLCRPMGVWLRSPSVSGLSASIVVLPDPLVLGERYGKEVRRLVLDKRFQHLEVFVPFPDESAGFELSLPASKRDGIDTVIACGRYCSADLSGFDGSRILLVHPTGLPNEMDVDALREQTQVGVMLPEIDLSGQNWRWVRLARSRNWSTTLNSGVAQDLRAAWPSCLEAWYWKEIGHDTSDL